MPRYRARALEIEAFTMDDGRMLIAAEPPRIVEAEEFHAAFEPAPERRTRQRRTIRKKPAGRRRQDRTKAAAAEAPPVTVPIGPVPDRASRTAEQLRADRQARDESAITAVRSQVDGEVKSRERGGPESRIRLEPGQKPGAGRKGCKKCHIVNPAAVKQCVECGAAF